MKSLNIKKIFNVRLFALNLYILLNYIAYPPILAPSYLSYSLIFLLFTALYNIIINRKIYWSNYSTWFSILMFYGILSIIYAESAEHVSNSIYSNFIVPFILTFSITQLIEKSEDIVGIIRMLALSSSILFFLMLYHGLFDITDRLGTELVGNANTFALMVMLSVIAKISYMFIVDKRLVKILLGLLLILDFYMLLLSEGRKFIITPILFFVILYLKNNNFKINKAFGMVLGLIVLIPIVWGFIINSGLFSDSLVSRFEMTGAFISGNTGMMGDGDKERIAMITKGLEYFSNAPLLGNGHHNFGYLFSFDWFDAPPYSHNNYVELLCNLGVVGILVYYSLYFMLLKKTFVDKDILFSVAFAFIIALMIIEFGVVTYYSQNLIQILLSIFCVSIFGRRQLTSY